MTICAASKLDAQRFSCDGKLLIATSDEETTTISRQVAIPFSPPFISPLVKYWQGSFDALGFNPADNFIYAVKRNTNAIVRLKSNNRFDTVGIVPFVDVLASNAGDCTGDGLYLCYEQELNQLLVFDVVNSFALVDRIDLFWDPSSVNSGPFRTKIYDFAIDPQNPKFAYAFQGKFNHEDFEPQETRGRFLKINVDFNDPDLGMVTPVIATNTPPISHIGGLMFSTESNLHAYGTPVPGQNPVQSIFYSVNPVSGTAFPIITNGPEGVWSDGCSCPFSFFFTYDVPTEGMFCTNDTKFFVLKFYNNSNGPIENVTLRDTLPEGMIIEDITGAYIGNLSNGTGPGTDLVEITNFIIPANSEVEIKIKVNTVDALVGDTYCQAFLHDMPERFEGVVGSDFPGTTGVAGDPSLFFVTAINLESLTWEITPPSDCLIANDGQIRVASPEFVPGQELEVKVRNKVGWDVFTYDVVIDQNNSFLMDSLLPGDYQVFQLRSIQDNCSFSVKDTTIILEAPNDQLQLSISNNAPVCEGENIVFNSTVFPDGKIRWTGPNLFASEEYDTGIDSATTAFSGDYKVVLKYGFCKQEREFGVDVKPLINASISGDLTYCERDRLQLKVEAAGDSLRYIWKSSEKPIFADSTLVLESVTQDDEGFYELVVDNGACTDTSGVTIDILDTPTLSLPDIVQTDFCEPLVLIPEVTGDINVRYSWFPEAGLNCIDCPSPEVESIVQPEYKLTVINDVLCSDSAEVRIILEKENLLYTPNVFLQSSTNNNHKFTVFPGCVTHKILQFEIFDRSGSKVYSRSDLDQNTEFWDGYINGKSGSSGVYIWMAKIELVDGSLQYLKGDVTLLRG